MEFNDEIRQQFIDCGFDLGDEVQVKWFARLPLHERKELVKLTTTRKGKHKTFSDKNIDPETLNAGSAASRIHLQNRKIGRPAK